MRTLGRFGEVTLPGLVLVLGFVLLPALGTVEKDNLLPGDFRQLPGVGPGALAVTNTVSAALFAAFLPGDAPGSRRGWMGMFASLGLLALVLCAVTVGRLGAELTAAMPYPFFALIRDVRILQLLERAEALIAAQWVITDFLLTAMLLQAGGQCVSLAFAGPGERQRTPVLAGATLGLIWAFFAPEALTAYVPAVNALLLFGVLVLVFVLGKLRRRI